MPILKIEGYPDITTPHLGFTDLTIDAMSLSPDTVNFGLMSLEIIGQGLGMTQRDMTLAMVAGLMISARLRDNPDLIVRVEIENQLGI